MGIRSISNLSWRRGFIRLSLCAVLLAVGWGGPRALAQGSDSSDVWTEDWESPGWMDDWHTDFGVWEAGAPASGPGAAFEGGSCAATILSGSYPETAESRLIRHTPFVVPNRDENPRLRYWHWFSFGGGDSAWVEIRPAGGEWQRVSTTYTGWSAVWTRPSIDLAPFAGSTVEIAFHYRSTNCCRGADNSAGWYIDSVEVVTGPTRFRNPDGFEGGLRDWRVEHGVWEVGIPSSGPGEARTGEAVAATVLVGTYPEAQSSRLISPSVEIPRAEENPRLRFWQWYSFGGGDSGHVQVRVLGGEWQTISPAYTSWSGDWFFAFLPLTEFAGQTVEIAFLYRSTNCCRGADNGSGWYIDDVVIEPVDLPGPPRFVRGDTDADGDTTVTDAIRVLNNLFIGDLELDCRDAADTDDDGSITVTDAIVILNCQFLGTRCPAAPFEECGTDPTDDGLDCVSFDRCQ